MGIPLTAQEQVEVFGTDRIDALEQEAEQRWGDTDSFRESARRTAGYTKDDWVRMKAEADAITTALAAASRADEPAHGPVARAQAEAHREHIERWFYPCSHAMHRDLAELYVADERFAATYDGVEPGLAAYMRAAILANADGR